MKVLLLTGLGALFFSYYWDDNFDPAGLQGARVLLTGASAGIGEELAYLYARLGAHLVLTAHTEALLQKVRQPISWGGSGWKTGPGCKNFLAKIQASGVTLGK